MAEKKNQSQTSLFKMATVSAPIAIGGGMAISRLSKASNSFGQPVSSLPINPANDVIRQFTNRYVNPQRSGIYKDWQLEKLSGLAQDISLTADQTRNSIMRAARLADPTGSVENMFATRLGTASTGSEVLKDMHNILSSSDSIYAQRAASIFLEDVGILDKRVSSGLPISTSRLSNKIVRKKKFDIGVLDPGTRQDVLSMTELLGAKVKIAEYSRKDIKGAELALTFSNSDKFQGKFTLRIPRVLPGQEAVISRGATQQSKYIAGMYGIVESGQLVGGQSFNHEQWTARRAVEELIPQITRGKVLEQREVRKLVNNFESSLMESPEWIPSLQGGTHKGVEEYTAQRSNIMRLYTREQEGGLRQLNEREYYQLMAQGGAKLPSGETLPLYPSSSPGQIAKGVASTKDFRSAMSLVPEAVPYGRRPLQFIRPGSEPLYPEMIAQDKINQKFAWAGANIGVPSPMVRAAYISPSIGSQFSGTGVTSEGQFLISDRLNSQRAVKKIRQFNVASNQMVDLANMINPESGSYWDINKQAEAGTFLGYSPEGRPVTLPKNMSLLNATAFEDKPRGNFIRVMATEEIEGERFAKVFGGTKGMGRTVRRQHLANLLTSRADASEYMASEIDALITMDDLKKNRGLHYNQMFTSLWDFTNQNIQSGKTNSLLASNFANNPIKMITKMRSLASDNDKFSHEAMLSQIKGVARMANLDPQQMGQVFGAVPDVFDQGIASLGSLSSAERSEISKGVATGATQLFFEDVGAPGAGKTATIEPRTFELLGAPHFGSLGPQLQQEVADRMVRAYPERIFEQTEIDRAIKSVQNLEETGKGTSPDVLLRKLKSQDAFPDEATTMNVKGMGDVYIPSGSQMSQMASYKTPGGFATESTLALAYKNLATSASQYGRGEINQAKMSSELANLEDELFKSKVATITGQKGLLRNRLPGSVALTALQPTMRESLDNNTVGITAPMADKMFQEMRQLGGQYSKESIEEMKRSFHRGGKIAGAIARHPFIGPYSTQAAYFQKVAGDEPVAMINERMQRSVAFRGSMNAESITGFEEAASQALRGDQKAIQKLQQQGAEMMGSPIRLSPFVGMAGDVDGDMVSAMFAGPQLQKSLSSHLTNQNAIEAYEEYSIRSQVLKAKGKGDEVTLRKVMAGDALKLGITQGGRLGKLSSSLQQYRAATISGMGNLSTTERMDALGLLEWLEQTPISGKHIAPGKELETIHLLGDLQESLDKKNANEIANAANAVMTQAKQSGQGALRDGFTIAMEDLETGNVNTRFIRGLDTDKASQNLVNVMGAYESASVGGESAARMRRLSMGKISKLTASDKKALLSQEALDMSPFGSLFTSSQEPTGLGRISGMADSLMRRAAQTGRNLLPAMRPLGLGVAAALGIATVLSEPPKVMSVGSGTAPMANMSSGTGGANLGFGEHPHERQMGQPTSSNLVSSQHSARLSPQDNSGYRVSIRGGTAENINVGNLNRQMQQAIGGNTRVNSSIRDQRSSLTPQKLSSILHDE